MNEIKKALYRIAAQAAEREGLKTRKGLILSILKFFTPVLFVVALAVADFWITVSPVLYIAFALAAGWIYYNFFLLAFVSGQVRGAKYALQNPRSGETWIEITDEGEKIWESEKFIPAPALPETTPLEIPASEIKTPDRPADFISWMHAWNRVIEPMLPIKGEEEIRKELARQRYPSSKKTYILICTAGNAGLLTMREYERKFGSKDT